MLGSNIFLFTLLTILLDNYCLAFNVNITLSLHASRRGITLLFHASRHCLWVYKLSWITCKQDKKNSFTNTPRAYILFFNLSIFFHPCNKTRNSIRNRVGQHNLKGLPPAANFSIRGSTISHIRLILQKISRVLPQQSPKPINQLWKDLESNEVFRKPHQFYRQIEDKT
jgi:hypothetical protein